MLVSLVSFWEGRELDLLFATYGALFKFAEQINEAGADVVLDFRYWLCCIQKQHLVAKMSINRELVE